jgi:Leucine-rich repeat (LRR) protein
MQTLTCRFMPVGDTFFGIVINKMTIKRTLPIIFVLCCIARMGHTQRYEELIYNFSKEIELSDEEFFARESMALLDSVKRIFIQDGCISESFFRRFDSLKYRMPNVYSLSLNNPYGNGEQAVKMPIERLLVFPRLRVFRDYIGYIPEDYQFPDYLRDSLLLLECRCPDNADCQRWALNIINQLHNLEFLEITITHGKVDLGSACTKLKKLRELRIRGVYQQSEVTVGSLEDAERLTLFSMELCHSCKAVPPLPKSLVTLSIDRSSVSELDIENLRSLPNLRKLNLSMSRITSFPLDFNFSQLTYFSTSRHLFDAAGWQKIRSECKGTVNNY